MLMYTRGMMVPVETIVQRTVRRQRYESPAPALHTQLAALPHHPAPADSHDDLRRQRQRQGGSRIEGQVAEAEAEAGGGVMH